jgi:hypothetical protein
MKKLSILLIGLLLVSGLAFAQDVTVTGSATLTFGMDLNNNATGFQNEAASSISLEWLSGDEESGTQGWITLSGWEISFASDDAVTVAAPSVEAGWMFDPVTVTIWSAPSFAAGNAAGFVFSDDDDPADVVKVSLSDVTLEEGEGYENVEAVLTADLEDDDIVLGTDSSGEVSFIADEVGDTASSYQGLTASSTFGPATLSLIVASAGTWEENVTNAYALGGIAEVAAGPATVTLGAHYGPFQEPGDIGLTAGIDATLGPATVDIGVDYWVPGETYDASLGLSADVAGLGLGATTYVADGDPDLKIDQEVTVDASGLVEGLALSNTFQMIDIMVLYGIYNETALAYATGGIMPFAAFGYLVETDYGVDPATTLSLIAGVELSGFVENTVFTLQYESEDLAEEGDKGVITAAGTISF